MAQPTTAPASTPNHPALTLRAPLVAVDLAVLVDLVLDVAEVPVVVAAVGLPGAGVDVAAARGAVDWPAI